jgi:hypothetical protein
MRANAFVLLLVILTTLLPEPGLALEPREVFRAVEPTIVVVRAALKDTGSQGSGVLVAPLDVVTSCHVVGDSTRISVSQGSFQRSARVRFRDRARDLCMLRLEDGIPDARTAHVLPPGTPLEVGQRVFAIGAPRGLERSLSVGIISALRGDTERGGAPLIQTDAAVSPGSSGGGLFDEEGRLVGLVTLQFRDSQNLNFAIPAAWIADLPARNRDLLADTPTAASPGASVEARPSAPSKGPIRQGDWWTYAIKLGGRTVGKVTVSVASITGEKVTESFAVDTTRSFTAQRAVDAVFSANRFQPLVQLPGGYQFAELSAYFLPDSGIKRGQTWTEVPGEFVIFPIGKKWLNLEVNVADIEKIRVPAGEFSAWRVDALSAAERYNGNQIRIKCTYWYSPEVGKAVKFSVATLSEYVVVTGAETYELVAFQKGAD